MKKGDLILFVTNDFPYSFTKHCRVYVFPNDICIFLEKLNCLSGTYYKVFHVKTQNIFEVQDTMFKTL
jgi:hypothetical protein